MPAISELLNIMAQLRDPEHGCPWDVEQDFASVAPYTLEEAYEVVDAIQRNDMTNLKEELGDLLLQVVFHSQMAAEKQLFTFNDVAASISEKMISRHPHVFSDKAGIESAEQQVQHWEELKAKEKQTRGEHSAMDDVPAAFPALLRAQKLGKKAAKKGFDWPDKPPVIGKIEEELQELKDSIDKEPIERQEEELGDLLFAVVNLARHLKLDAETALRKANLKIENRFRQIEPHLHDDRKLEEMEALWQAVK